jgi:hypothetical protein
LAELKSSLLKFGKRQLRLTKAQQILGNHLRKKEFNLISAEFPMPQLDQDLIEDIQAELGQQVKL